jgi:RND family efflux transporter MFP subunit
LKIKSVKMLFKKENLMSSKGNSKHRFKWLFAGLVPLLAGGVFLYLYAWDRKQPAQTPQYVTYTVESITQSEVIEVSGNIEPVETEDIGFATSGEVIAIHVEEGDWVEEGTLIAELDNTQQVYALASLDYSIAKAKVSGSRGELELLQLERESKVKELEERRLYTTISGIVSKIDVREGEYTKSVDQITPIARVINVSSLRAEVEVDELDVPRIAVGQKVKFYFDALPNFEVIGRVYSLPYEGRVTSEGIAVIDAELMIDNPAPEIIPGYSFSAQIVVNDEEKVLVLDEDAIMKRNGETMALVRSQDGGPLNPRIVKTVSFRDGKVKVLSGLAEGDTVISFNEMPFIAGQSAKREEVKEGRSVIDMLGLPTGPHGARRPSGGGK